MTLFMTLYRHKLWLFVARPQNKTPVNWPPVTTSGGALETGGVEVKSSNLSGPTIFISVYQGSKEISLLRKKEIDLPLTVNYK